MGFRTLIVDDTVIWRKILSESLATFSEIELTGTASNGEIALKKISRDPPDLILLDVHMPGMDGIELLKILNASYPQIAVIMVSGDASANTRATIEALQAGAIDFICKPESNDLQQNITDVQRDLKSVLRVMELRLNNRKISPVKVASPVNSPSLPQQPLQSHIQKNTIAEPFNTEIPKLFSICTIGVSTGGPDALSKLIPLLPASFPLPILLVQHMPPLFTKSLAESLDKKAQLTVKEAAENDILTPGVVYIAPGGKHMIVRHVNGKRVIGINEEPPENSCRPSVDVLFRSIAANFGDNGVLALVLTGMGSDGLNGMRTLKRKKCFCITQSESTCVVYGMPRSVDEAKLSDRSLPLMDIASEMVSLTKNSIFSHL